MMQPSRTQRAVASTLAALLVWSPLASAAPPAPPTPDSPSAAPSKSADQDEARRRYERALELSDEGNYEGALLELKKAYELAPTYRLFYNLGVVSVAMRDYVRAVDYFTRYLDEGGSGIEPTRVTEVRSQIERLRNRIALLTIEVTPEGAEVALDDVPIGKAPLPDAVKVNAGRHKVSATLPGRFPATAVIELAGNESKTVRLSPALAPVVTVRQEAPASRPLPWIAYGVTAALGAGALTTGILALSARGSYDDTVNTPGVSADDVRSDYRTMRGFSVASDVLLGATVIAAGVSVYLTLKRPSATPKTRGSFTGATFHF